jgi:hypothetical protein
MKWVMIDATIICAHQHSFGAKGGGKQDLGRFLRAFLRRFFNKNSCRCALALIDGMKTDALLADKGYNANYIVEAAQNMGAIAVIPPKSFIKRVTLLKDYSINLRISVGRATRYDKTAAAFMG